MGALVIVGFSVLVIPWVLDGPQRRDATTREIELPESQDRGKTYRFSLGEDSDEEDDSSKPVAENDLPPTSNSSPSPVKETPAAVDPPAVSAPAAAPGGWTVQVGSFSSHDNASALVQTLKRQGFEAHINEHTSGGAVHFRVRVGEFESRDSADALAIRIRGETGEPARPVQLP